jgi:methylenetetrahydrofolate reductase (NADPH)
MRDNLRTQVIQLMRAASTEITVSDEALLPALKANLPAGSSVHVAHTPKNSLDQVVDVALAVQQTGLCACPHIVARRIQNETALRAALVRLAQSGVDQVLLVAGDRQPPLGSYTSTLEILDSGALIDAGIRRIGVAGHPDGHPAIDSLTLWQALADKQRYGERTGIAVQIVSQFSFNPDAVYDWQRDLASHGITLPVRVGIAGPTPLIKLLQFAVRCGVGTSVRSAAQLLASAKSVSNLATSPEQHLLGLARAHAAGEHAQLVAPHFFAFGGTLKTVQWMHRLAEGGFEVDGELKVAAGMERVADG